MQTPAALLKQRTPDNWLIGGDSRRFSDLTQLRIDTLSDRIQHYGRPRIFLSERNPEKFLAGFMAACITGCPLFLCNPDWGRQEWQQVLTLVQPDLIWGEAKYLPQTTASGASQDWEVNWIMIPTGGTSGILRFAIHTWHTLMASVQGTQAFFFGTQHPAPIHSFCVLPLHHVSGLMQFLRSFGTHGQLVIWPFKTLKQGKYPEIDTQNFFISLVPTQLQRLIQHNERSRWLSQFHTVLLGGAPAWPQLLERARNGSIPLAPTYGMTETASQVVTLKPADFLKGNNSSGQVVPHARILIQDPVGHPLATNEIGQIVIQSQSLCLGYYPQPWRDGDIFVTDDLGFMDNGDHGLSVRLKPFGDDRGYLHIVGRNSRKIMTGGENVCPEEVEATIRATALVDDIYVVGVPDQEWGEVVTAIYVPATPDTTVQQLRTALEGKLSKFKHPKQWLALDTLPRNGQGKINRNQLQTLLTLRSTSVKSR